MVMKNLEKITVISIKVILAWRSFEKKYTARTFLEK